MKNQRKNLPKLPRGRNDRPERRFAHELLKHLHGLGFSFDVVDSSTFNKQAGYHTENDTEPGFSDLVGNNNEGLAMYIECKAPGKRNALRASQREFLTHKIMTNCFAIVCDSVAHFDKMWASWTFAVDRRNMLLANLPPPTAAEKRRDDSDLSFDD